jgi:hypothetical protein
MRRACLRPTSFPNHGKPVTVEHLAANLTQCHWLLTSTDLTEAEEARLAQPTSPCNVRWWSGTAVEECQRAMHTLRVILADPHGDR